MIRSTPIFLWLFIQVSALSLITISIPLWSRHSSPREFSAFSVMFLTQICAATALFPQLLPNRSTAFIVALFPWPFLQLAAILFSTPQYTVLATSVYVTFWITSLFAVTSILKSRQSISIAITVGQLYTLGGVLLWYLASDSTDSGHSFYSTAFGPVLGGLSITRGELGMMPWIEASAPVIAVALGVLICRLFRTHHIPATFSHQDIH